MHILTVVGARPQFIKCAPLSTLIRQNHTEYLVHTGQHYDTAMSDLFFEELSIPPPDVNLGVGSGRHGAQLSAMIDPLETLMIDQQPDWVLVYGDTNSTLAAALAASKLNLPIAHVESGLRSFNRTMPEEINRVLTDHVSTLLLCPTPVAVANLKQEGITEGVVMTGDIMVDSVQRATHLAEARETVQQRLELPTQYGAITLHRPANTDHKPRLEQIVQEINRLTMPLVFPLHPRTRKMLHEFNLHFDPHVHVIDPLGYVDMLMLVRHAQFLLTDSGGLQKEAYILKTPCVTLRPETEWVETLEIGWNRLAEPDTLTQQVADAMQSPPMAHPALYGDGTTARQILAHLSQK